MATRMATTTVKSEGTTTVTPEGNTLIKSEVKEFQVGDRVRCFWHDTLRDAEILDKRKGSDRQGTQYYVHFTDFDRRNDRWADGHQLQEKKEDDVSAIGVIPNSPHLGVLNSPLLSPGLSNGKRMTRRKQNRQIASMEKRMEGPEEADLEREHFERTKVKNIGKVEFGQHEVDTWYFSPYPLDVRNVSKLWICEFCLKYMKKHRTLLKHSLLCKLRHPPGTEIYRHQNLALWEIDGGKEKLYCQCLCLLAKLFIDHKTLYYDVEPFLFYVLTTVDKEGYHLVGYFSKEKSSAENYNLACILTFPQYQRNGYGKLLISFSYELSKIEQKVGSPEKPLSDLGKVSYRSYWTRVLLNVLKLNSRSQSIKEVSLVTSIKPEDIISTLQYLGLVRYCKGQHVISVTPRLIEQHEEKLGPPPKLVVVPSKIRWTPKTFPAPKKPKRAGSHTVDKPTSSSDRPDTTDSGPTPKRRKNSTGA
eukprot:gb/GEZN01003962.1/.p1 GENE.gb/GEZN01003962.1/~~gb/GEZN01003962.1/.p1  ORF type:complete len:474 (+),score=57.25 gb/GEZN01003962.1/:45-1466(+)